MNDFGINKRFDYELEKSMDEAIIYLSNAFRSSGHNEKPVLMHSIRVGMTLFDLGYNKSVVLSGILHDILEDTDTSYTELYDCFGKQIANTVSCVSFKPEIRDSRKQNEEMFLRCKNFGFDALAVKCADILDNIDYFVPTKGYEELAEILIEKYHLFLKISDESLNGEELYSRLKLKIEKADILFKRFNETK